MEAVGRKVAINQVIGQAATDGAPVFVEGCDRQHVREIDLVHERVGLLEEPADISEAFGVDCISLVNINRARNTADQVIRVGILATEDRVDFDDFLLPLQGLDVVGHPEQVDFGGSFMAG